MNFFTGFFKAISNCFKGFSFIFEKGLWPYLFYPVIVWLLMWLGSILIFASLAEHLSNVFNSFFDTSEIPEAGGTLSFLKPFLTSYFSFILKWVLKIIFWFASGTLVKYITLIFLSPLFALLSESVEQKVNGNNYPFNIVQLLKDIGRGILMSIRNMLFEYLIIAVCFIITLFFAPLIVVTGPLLVIMSWYFLGFTMMDYNFERHKMSVSQSVKFARKNKGIICGIGIVYSFFMILPLFLGLMFAPLLAVVGGTLSFIELKQKETPTVI